MLHETVLCIYSLATALEHDLNAVEYYYCVLQSIIVRETHT